MEILSFYTCVPSIKIIWCMVPEIWNSTDRIFFFFFVILGNFNTLKNENIKHEKIPGDIIILHKCTKNHDHMLYYSWDMARVACNCYFSFWAIFSPFIPLTAQKIKISHTKKKHLEVSSFNTSVQKIMIICFIVSEIWHLTDVVVSFHFGLFFNLLPR